MKEQLSALSHQAIALLAQAQGVLEVMAEQLPRDEGGDMVGLPTPRDILRDAGDTISQVIEDLEIF